jgi:hypothetical protein
MALSIAGRTKWLEDHPHSDLDDWRTHLHQEFEWDLQHICWMPLICQIHQLALRYLEVNVQNCFCPCGCASQLAWAVSWLCDWEDHPPDVLVVSGTRNKEERTEIEAIVMTPGRSEHPELRFEKCLDAITLAVNDG